jgi:hypothetical protein
MLCSTIMQIFKSKYLIFWAAQKWQILTSVIVNSVDFRNLTICQSLLFLYSPEYYESRVQNLYVGRSYHRLHLEFFSEFFETLKYYFRFFQKSELHVARATKILSPANMAIVPSRCLKNTKKFGRFRAYDPMHFFCLKSCSIWTLWLGPRTRTYRCPPPLVLCIGSAPSGPTYFFNILFYY